MGKASTRAQNKYILKAYDRINLTVPKGMKDEIKAHAEAFDGGSMNGFINRAIVETLARDERRREKIGREIREQKPDVDDMTFAMIAAEREELQRATQSRLDALQMMKRKKARPAADGPESRKGGAQDEA